MLRALIVDDEEPARARFARLLTEVGGIDVIGEAEDGIDALREVRVHHPDVLFLDVQMPRLDGFGVAEALGREGPLIVFVTAYDQHALRAFAASAVDYLVKPVARRRLADTVATLSVRREPQRRLPAAERLARLPAPERIALRSGSDFHVVPLRRLTHVVAQDHYAVLHVEGDEEERLCDDPLDELAQRLGGAGFLRVHRAAIVSLDAIVRLERQGDRKYVAVLRGGARVPVSRQRLPALKAALGVV